MGRAALNLLGSAGQGRRDRLGESILGLGKRTRSRGAKDRSEPDGQGKSGLEAPCVVVDRGGVPLAVSHTAANVHDSKVLEEAVDTIKPIKGPRGRPGRPRKRPKKLHAYAKDMTFWPLPEGASGRGA